MLYRVISNYPLPYRHFYVFLLQGKYHIEFALDFKNVTIAHWKVPMSRKYLQLAEFVDDDDDDVKFYLPFS